MHKTKQNIGYTVLTYYSSEDVNTLMQPLLRKKTKQQNAAGIQWCSGFSLAPWCNRGKRAGGVVGHVLQCGELVSITANLHTAQFSCLISLHPLMAFLLLSYFYLAPLTT